MNEKLNDILSTLYNEPDKFYWCCVKNLVNKTLPNVNFEGIYCTLGMLAFNGYYSMADFAEVIKGQFRSFIPDYIVNLNDKISSFSKKLINITDSKSLYNKISNLAQDGIVGKVFMNNLKAILSNEENCKDAYSPIIASLILSKLEEKDSINYDEINKFATLIFIAIVYAGENKNLPKNVEELRNRSLEIIEKIDIKKHKDAQTLLNSYSVFSALAIFPRFAKIRCRARYSEDIDKDDNVMIYYENCITKPLISQKTTIKQGTNIIDALKGKDLIKNSSVIEYVLQEIEKKAYTRFKVLPPYTALIGEIVFLILCNQLNVNIDDKILFAIVNPISKFKRLSSSKNFRSNVDISKKIATEILGEEIK